MFDWERVLKTRASFVAQMVKNLPAVRETWIRSLGREDPLEKGMTTHSSILAKRIPWVKEPGGLTVRRVAKSQTWPSTNTCTFSGQRKGRKYDESLTDGLWGLVVLCLLARWLPFSWSGTVLQRRALGHHLQW